MKRVSNQVPSNFLRLVIIGCPSLSLRRERMLVHQQRSQLVEFVARETMMISVREQIIVFAMVKLGSMIGISQI